MKNLFILFFILVFVDNALESAPKTTKNVPLLLSELTVDKVPGDNGSWIELYNPGDKPVDANGTIILCNNREIYKFTKRTVILPKFIVLVRFLKDSDNKIKIDRDDRIVTVNSESQAKSVKPDHKKVFKQPIIHETDTKSVIERTPGYCALFKDSISEDNLTDYVLWGDDYNLGKISENIINRKHFQWALTKKLWTKGVSHKHGLEGVFIGVNPGPGNDPWPKENAVIARMNFPRTKNVNNCWQVVCPKSDKTESDPVINQKITPGKPNKWFVPSLTGDGVEWTKVDEIEIYESRFTIDRRRLALQQEEKGLFRLQIASDPYFQELIYDKRTEFPAKIDKKILKPKRYYSRARVEMKSCKTDWSPTIKFSYDLKEQE